MKRRNSSSNKSPKPKLQKIDDIQKDISNKGENAYQNELPEIVLFFDNLIEEFGVEMCNTEDKSVSKTEIPKSAIYGESEMTLEKAKILAAKSLLKAKDSLLKEEKSDETKKNVIKEMEKELSEIKELKLNKNEEVEIIPANNVLVSLVTKIRNAVVKSLDMISGIKMWIQLKIPKIEDGNNFGVGIQEECVDECNKAEDMSFSMLEHTSKIFPARGELITKVIKHPQIRDYYQSVIEYDQMEYTNLKLGLVDLRNHYAILHDIITKNLERIEKPRSEEALSSMF